MEIEKSKRKGINLMKISLETALRLSFSRCIYINKSKQNKNDNNGNLRQQRGGELLRIVSYNNSCLTLKTSTTL